MPIVRTFLSLCLTLLAFPLIAATPVAALVEAHDAATVAPEVYLVQDLSVVSDHLRITLKSGQASLVMVGDQPIGFFFKGQGALIYQADDAVEIPVLMTNAKRSTKLRVEKEGSGARIDESFETLFYRAAGVSLPEFKGPHEQLVVSMTE